MRTLVIVLIVPLVAAGAVAATAVVGSDSSTGNAPEDANAIVIMDFAYSPAPLRLDRGTTVTVTNDDDAPHTLTADDGSFDTGDLGDGDTETITVDDLGRYTYHCDIHEYMTGVIEVGE